MLLGKESESSQTYYRPSKRMPPAPLDLRGGQNSCTGLQPVPNAGGIYDTCTRVSFTISSDSYYIWKMCWDEWPRLSLIDGDWYQFSKQMTVCKAEMLTQLDGEKVAPLEVSKSSSPGHRKAYRFPVIPSTSQTSAIIKAQASKRLAAHRLLSPPGSSWFPWIMKLAVQLLRPKHWASHGFEWMNKLQGLHSNFASCTKGTQHWGSGLGNWPYLLQS